MSNKPNPPKVVEHAYILGRFCKESDLTPFRAKPNFDFVKTFMKKFLTKSDPDVIFVVGDMAYGCHRAVLREHSEIMADYLPTGMIFSLPPKVTLDGFLFIYNSMLLPEVSCKRGQLMEMLQAARYFFIPRLVSYIFQHIGDRCACTEPDALRTYYDAVRDKKIGIAMLMMSCVNKHFMLLICSTEYREMPLACVLKLLSSNSLAVQHEIEVLYAGLYWVYAKYDVRKQHIRVVLRTVRFVLLPTMFIFNTAARLHELTPRVADELAPHLHKTMLYLQRLKLGQVAKDEVVVGQRCWITDPECPYINRESVIARTCVFGPIDFMTYIKRLNCAEDFLARIYENDIL